MQRVSQILRPQKPETRNPKHGTPPEMLSGCLIIPIRMAPQAGIKFIDVVSYFVVFIVHFGFRVLMAGAEATERSKVVGLKVARLAIIPCIAVVAAEDWEELPVVIKVHIVPVILIVTVQAGSLNPCAGVFIVIVCLMAADAIHVIRRVEDQRVIGFVVAGITGCTFVGTYQCKAAGDGKVINVLRVIPGINSMAIQAGDRKSTARMFIVVVGLMATDAVHVIHRLINGGQVRGFVTRGTGQAFMSSEEIESSGCSQVVKQGALPL